jgi:hypothetical protein
MVLNTRVRPGALLLLAVALLSTGCLNKVPPQRLEKRAPIAVCFAIDDLEDAPERFKQRIFEALDSRNLEAREVPAGALGGQRLSTERFRALQAAAASAPFALLVEVHAAYFTQINGRFRWTVSVKLSAARTGSAPSQDAADFPALLQFENEKTPEALDDVSDYVASRIKPLADGLLIGQGTTDAGAEALAPGDTVYFVMVDRFANGDRQNDGPGVDVADPVAFHGGDFAGVREHLDWLEGLGVGTVWLSPVFAMRTEPYHGYAAFHGYWVERLDAVEPRFGTVAELRALRDALDQRGIGLMLDVVLNHVGPGTALTLKKPEWFHGRGSITDWNDPVQLVMNDVQGLPDFAVERDDVYAYLLGASLDLVRKVQPKGFRLDAVKHLPVAFWARYNAALRKAGGPHFQLLGELLDGDAAKVARVWREGGFTAMFDFPLRFALIDVLCKGQSPAHLGAVLTEDRRYPDPAALVTLVDNHDLPRLATECPQHAQAAIELMYAMRGTPSLTWGTEVGLTGEREPQNRGSMRFDPTAPMRAVIIKAAAVRRAHPSLTSGALKIAAATDAALTLQRISASEIATIEVRGQNVDVSFAQGDFRVQAEAARRQWLTGSRTRRVELRGPSGVRVVGSGPELGEWKLERALPLPAWTELPEGGVFELKLWSAARAFEPGPNRVLFVEAGEGALQVDLDWRGS